VASGNLTPAPRTQLRSLLIRGSCRLPVSALQSSWAPSNQRPHSQHARPARHKRGAVCGSSPPPPEGTPPRGSCPHILAAEGAAEGPKPAVLAVCAPGQAEGCWVSAGCCWRLAQPPGSRHAGGDGCWRLCAGEGALLLSPLPLFLPLAD